MREVKLILQKSKETKNTVRYDELGGERETICPAIYLQKSHLTQPYPERIELTIGMPR